MSSALLSGAGGGVSNLDLLTRKLFILESRLIAPCEDLIGSC
jgi:hypothetical protein